LNPGNKVWCTIDLGQYYTFASESNDNSYEIKYSVISMELSSNASTSASVLESLDSNILTIKIDARNAPTQALWEQNLQSLNNFRGCDTARQSLLLDARSRSVNATNDALSVIDCVGELESSLNCPLYKEWFGNYDFNRHMVIRNRWDIVTSPASIMFDCTCTR
jgi:hypothetical protein